MKRLIAMTAEKMGFRFPFPVQCLVIVCISLISLLAPGCSPRPGDIPRADDQERALIEKLSRTAMTGEASQWHSFQGGPLNNGITNVEISGASLETLWEFQPGSHVWEYGAEMSAWSPCPVFGEVDGRTLLFTGCHDRNVYCLDAATGKMVWQRATGGLVLSSLLFVEAAPDQPAVVVAVSSDRSVYGLDPATGTIRWTRETYPWTNTIAPSVTSSPALWRRPSGRNLVVATIFNSDVKWLRPRREGLLLVLTPQGEEVARHSISETPVSSPMVISLGEERAVALVAERKGRLMAISLPDGKLLWQSIFSGNLYGTPSGLRLPDGRYMVALGDFFGRVEAHDAITGEMIWDGAKLGYFINATPALCMFNGAARLFVGSFDRMIHGFDLKEGRRYFSYMTGKYVASCCTTGIMAGKPALFVQSLDRSLYVLNLDDGAQLLKMRVGDMIWPYERPGRTLWSSAVPVKVTGKGSIVIVPFHDARIIAFKSIN